MQSHVVGQYYVIISINVTDVSIKILLPEKLNLK